MCPPPELEGGPTFTESSPWDLQGMVDTLPTSPVFLRWDEGGVVRTTSGPEGGGGLLCPRHPPFFEPWLGHLCIVVDKTLTYLVWLHRYEAPIPGQNLLFPGGDCPEPFGDPSGGAPRLLRCQGDTGAAWAPPPHSTAASRGGTGRRPGWRPPCTPGPAPVPSICPPLRLCGSSIHSVRTQEQAQFRGRLPPTCPMTTNFYLRPGGGLLDKGGVDPTSKTGEKLGHVAILSCFFCPFCVVWPLLGIYDHFFHFGSFSKNFGRFWPTFTNRPLVETRSLASISVILGIWNHFLDLLAFSRAFWAFSAILWLLSHKLQKMFYETWKKPK